MNTKRKIIKWTAVTAGTVIVAAVAYIALNTFDCEKPDLSKFSNAFEVPSEADNVYYGLVAATNVISEKTGLPVLTSVFSDKYDKAWMNFSNPNKDMTDEEKDAILAESEKVLSLFHGAAQRKTWCCHDPSGRRDPWPHFSTFIQLCRLAALQSRRHVELGKTGSAVEDVRDMILLTRKIEQDAESVIRWIAAGGTLNYAHGSALKIVRSGNATDEELLRLQDALRQFDLASRTGRAERMLNNDFTILFMQMTDKLEISEGGASDVEFAIRVLRIPLLGSYAYHRNRTWTVYANYLEKMKEGYRLGYDKDTWAKIDDETRVICNAGWRFGPNFAGRIMLDRCLPAWRAIGESIQTSTFRHSAVEMIVAAARFKSKTGAFPKKLSELVPEYLTAVPLDPYTKNMEIKYDPARGILWTVGKEGTFNGEPVKPDGKYNVYGKYGKENRNYVFNIDGTPASK